MAIENWYGENSNVKSKEVYFQWRHSICNGNMDEILLNKNTDNIRFYKRGGEVHFLWN